ncbi:MAG: DNA polymerase III subunit epsilon, partial [Maribacter sp.]|nr:DNA polymerase III subunit epsilon [Maribacter sp.]
TDCRLYLEGICKDFSLCAKYCHLQENVDSCSHYRIKQCEGICRGDESPESYNKKVEQAIHSIKDKSDHLIIQEKGRTSSESAFICIRDGIYTGYGFIEKEIQINKFEDLETFIIPQKNTLETERIIQSFVARNPHKPRQFSKVMDSEHY